LFPTKGGSRVHSYNPRNQVPSRFHKTIDENVILHRIMSTGKLGGLNRNQLLLGGGGISTEETLEDRILIFEDEIIKRIKIIQSFVKNLDGKVKRLN
jgi:hypothetical protein